MKQKQNTSNDEFDLIDEEIESGSNNDSDCSSNSYDNENNEEYKIIDVDKMTNIPIIRENVKRFGDYMTIMYERYLKEDLYKYIDKYRLNIDIVD